MRAIEPDMVLGKVAYDGTGVSLGEIVDVGLYAHHRVKFLVLRDSARRVPLAGRAGLRTVGVDAIADVSADSVRLSVV